MAYLDEIGVETLTAEIKDYADDTYSSKWILLWENASSTSEFAAQTISLNLTGYDFVLIQHFDFKSTDSDRGLINSIALVGTRCPLLYGWSNNRVGYRGAVVNSTGIDFGNNVYNSTTTNDNNVPYKIFGIQGVITT